MAPPGNAAQQQSGGSADNSMAPIWVAILVFLTAVVVWKTSHQYIVSAVFFITILQAKLVNIFLDSAPLADVIYLMQTVDPAAVGWHLMLEVMGQVGSYLRYPVAAILVIFALILYKSDVTHRFRKKYSMQTLRQQEQANWALIKPVVGLDLVTQNIAEGPWAMALSPMEFARKYDLLKKDDAILDNPVPGQEMTAGIRRGDAKRVFTLQLGPVFEGFDRTPPHVVALAAVFMARINRDRDGAANILEELNQTCLDKKPNYAVALKKHYQIESIQRILSSHAYILTVLASLLMAARDDGVVPTAEFLWLKPVDRRLWFMLNCVGRQTAYAEVAGPFAHWKAERAIQRRSLVPMIDEAVKALEQAVKEVKLTPRELQELKP